jgi:4'-phosphopantetheinyl transferase
VEVFWLTQNAAGVPPGNEWLSESERARLAELHIPKRYADWRLGRWTAKSAVAAYLKTAGCTAVEVRPAASGAPEVFVDGAAARLTLSLSHSGGVGLCAIGPEGSLVGCDVETIEVRSPAFLADYFTEEEQRMVAAAPVSRRSLLTTLLWSLKESALKALRCGLREDTRSVRVQVEDDGTAVVHAGGLMFDGRWWQTDGRAFTLVGTPGPLKLINFDNGSGKGPS